MQGCFLGASIVRIVESELVRGPIGKTARVLSQVEHKPHKETSNPKP